MTAARPTAILFDFDGVIVDSEALHHRAYERALAPYGVDAIPLEIYADSFSNRGVGLEYCAKRVPGLDVAELKRRKESLFREILESDARLLPGVKDTLGSLAERWPLAVATGSQRAAAAWVLDRFGLRGFFRAVIAREDYARDKPAPDAFLRACEAVGSAPEDCLVVEDSYKGLRAACAARIPCVVIPNDYTRSGDFTDAAEVLSSIRELSPDRIEEIHRRFAAR